MAEPTPEQIERAVAALMPFVADWNLPLNPEHLHELAYATLAHASSSASYEEIQSAVSDQLREFKVSMENLYRD